jgi:transposase
MGWYLGIDIGKRFHVACLADAEGKEVGVPLTFNADREGFLKLESFLKTAAGDGGLGSVKAGMEATGHYWLSLYLYLQERGLDVSVLNPLEVKAFRNEGIRGNKTDAVDAVKISKLLRFGDFREAYVPDGDMAALRQLTRLRGDLVETLTSFKHKATAVLDQLFPEYGKLFSDAFGVTSRALLSEASTPEAIAALPAKRLTAVLRAASRGRFGEEKAREVQTVARGTVGRTGKGTDMFAAGLEVILSEVDHLQEKIDGLDKLIAASMEVVPTTLTTIPGIGTTLAAVILAEIGDASRFFGNKDGAEKLVALAGLDPKLRSSGQFQGKTKMSKRGSPYLRHALHTASFVAVFTAKDPLFRGIYEKHREKGKHPEVAISHVSRKMTHVIFSLLKNNTPYDPEGGNRRQAKREVVSET